MIPKAWWKTAAVVVSAGLAVGCQTKQPVEPTTPEQVRAGAPIYFHPAVPRAAIMLESGRYPTLFDSASAATWIEPTVPVAAPAAAPAQASVAGMDKEDPSVMAEPVAAPAGVDEQTRALAANFTVIACDIASTFSDSSIAYDAVGLRNVQVYLMAADGRQVPPVQRIIGTELQETPAGALKRYQRRNLLLFPKDPFQVETPVAGTPSPRLRLVLEGYSSKFYFEWPAQVPGNIGAPPIGEQEWVQKGEEVYRGVRKKERAIIHKFD